MLTLDTALALLILGCLLFICFIVLLVISERDEA